MMNLLEEAAAATSLREGSEGVRSILLAAARGGNTPLKDLARAVRMPLPVVAAVRRELEKRGIFARDKGICLTEEGREIVSRLGIVTDGLVTDKLVTDDSFSCAKCMVIPESLQETLTLLHAANGDMPEVNVQLDQAFALPETSLRRALYAHQNGALAGRNVVFLGDDDLTSIAVALLMADKPAGSLTVVDIDARIISLIQTLSDRYELDIVCHTHDLREPLPDELKGRFHSFFTDPPYTVSGLKLFLARAMESLQNGPGRQGFLSFGHKDADTDIDVFRTIGERGFAPVEIIPEFNEYSGGGIIGNISRMIRLTSGSCSVGGFSNRFDDPVYTGEVNVSYRNYICTGCETMNPVGQGNTYVTVEALKTAGCPECGEKKFKLHRKITSSH